MRKLRKALELSASDWLIIVQAAGWFAAVEIGLRVLKLRTLLNILESEKEKRPPDRVRPSLERVAYCVEIASRFHAFRPTCLKKALVFYTLASRIGAETRLTVGTAKAGGKLEAHAWVEHKGRVILGRQDCERYTPLWRLDTPFSRKQGATGT